MYHQHFLYKMIVLIKRNVLNSIDTR